MNLGHCHYCGDEAELTKDHVIPRNRAQDRYDLRYDARNHRWICRPCNAAKADLLPMDSIWENEGPVAHQEKRRQIAVVVQKTVMEVIAEIGIHHVRKK